MSRPSSLGDFDVVTGPAAPSRPIAPALPAPAPDRSPPAAKPNVAGSSIDGKIEPAAA